MHISTLLQIETGKYLVVFPFTIKIAVAWVKIHPPIIFLSVLQKDRIQRHKITLLFLLLIARNWFYMINDDNTEHFYCNTLKILVF